jgi:hypothetical protein
MVNYNFLLSRPLACEYLITLEIKPKRRRRNDQVLITITHRAKAPLIYTNPEPGNHLPKTEII